MPLLPIFVLLANGLGLINSRSAWSQEVNLVYIQGALERSLTVGLEEHVWLAGLSPHHTHNINGHGGYIGSSSLD